MTTRRLETGMHFRHPVSKHRLQLSHLSCRQYYSHAIQQPRHSCTSPGWQMSSFLVTDKLLGDCPVGLLITLKPHERMCFIRDSLKGRCCVFRICPSSSIETIDCQRQPRRDYHEGQSQPAAVLYEVRCISGLAFSAHSVHLLA